MEKSINKKTPTSNTGVIPTKRDGLRFHIDWLQGTFPMIRFNKMRYMACKLLGGGKFEKRDTGICLFKHAYEHPLGVIMAHGKIIPKSKGLVDEELAYIQIPGSVLSCVPLVKVKEFIYCAYEFNSFKATRDDLTFDDYTKEIIDLDNIKKAVDKYWFTGFSKKTFKWTEQGVKGFKGKSATFGNRGSKGSGKRVLMYEKTKESDGKVDSNRLEVSLYKNHADQSLKQLAYAPIEEWGEIFIGWISGAIDFRKRQGEEDKNPARRQRVSWWKKIVDGVEKIKPDIEYASQSLDKTINWVYKQVAPILAALSVGLGSEFMEEVIKDGKTRFKEKHYWLINCANNPLCNST